MKVHYKVYWWLHDANGNCPADTYEEAMEQYAEFIASGCKRVIVEMIVIGKVVEFKDGTGSTHNKTRIKGRATA